MVKARQSINGTRRLAIVTFVVLAALLFLVLRGLNDATVYFRTADQAVADRQSLGNRRFRIEGTVVPGTVEKSGDAVAFSIENKGVKVPVHHVGDPPDLFKDRVPVVLEGHFAGTTFDSDRIMIRHSETYTAKNPSRVDKYVGKKGTTTTG